MGVGSFNLFATWRVTSRFADHAYFGGRKNNRCKNACGVMLLFPVVCDAVYLLIS